MNKDARKSLWQLIKYNMVGLMNTAVDFVVYQLLTGIGMGYAIAQVISYSCGIVNSYFFNSRWTFKAGEKRYNSAQFVKFMVVNIVSLCVSLVLLRVCYQVLGIESDFISKAIVTPVVMMVNFLGTKLIVFKK